MVAPRRCWWNSCSSRWSGVPSISSWYSAWTAARRAAERDLERSFIGIPYSRSGGLNESFQSKGHRSRMGRKTLRLRQRDGGGADAVHGAPVAAEERSEEHTSE